MAAIDNAITYAMDDRDRRTFIANKAILLDNLNFSNDAIYLLDSLSRNKPSYYNNDDQFYLLEQKAFVYGKYDLIKAYHCMKRLKIHRRIFLTKYSYSTLSEQGKSSFFVLFTYEKFRLCNRGF